MNFKYLSTATLAFLLIFTAVSCKDDKKDVTLPNLTGALYFNIPEYITYADESGRQNTFQMTPKGVKHPEGKSLGYYWKQTPPNDPANKTNDTVYLSNGALDPSGKTTLKFKDSLYTCTVSCGVFADGYNSTFRSKAVTVVKPGVNGSITMADFNGNYNQDKWSDSQEVTDQYTIIGNYKWTRRNLVPKSKGRPFKDCKAMEDVYGGYFTGEEARTACPAGWQLPDDQAWKDLGQALSGKPADNLSAIDGIAGKMMVNARFNVNPKKPEDKEEKYVMWEYWPEVKITNSSAFSAIPTGYANNMTGNHTGAYEPLRHSVHYAVFMTSDSVIENGTEYVYYRYIVENSDDLHIGKGELNSFAGSVRCVQKL